MKTYDLGETVRAPIYQKIKFGMLLLLIAFSATAFAQEAKRVLIFDVDGTLTRLDEEAARAGADTPYVLFRVPEPTNNLIEAIEGPEEVLITQYDFERMRLAEELAHREGNRFILGNQRKKVRQSGGGEPFTIGHYYFDPYRSLRYFRESTDPNVKSHLVANFERMIRELEPELVQGPAWPLLEAALSGEFKATVGWMTARGHSREEAMDLFELFKSVGWVKNTPERPTDIFNLSHADTRAWGSVSTDISVSEKKARILWDRMKALGRTPVEKGQMHTLLFADDNQTTIDKVEALFWRWQRSQPGTNSPIKLILVNLGTSEEISEPVPIRSKQSIRERRTSRSRVKVISPDQREKSYSSVEGALQALLDMDKDGVAELLQKIAATRGCEEKLQSKSGRKKS